MRKEILINLKNQGFKILSLNILAREIFATLSNRSFIIKNILNEILISQKTNPSQRNKRFSEFFLCIIVTNSYYLH